MSDEELIAQLKNSKGWPTLGNAAAARIEALTAELAECEARLDKALEAISNKPILATYEDHVNWLLRPCELEARHAGRD